MTAKQRYNYNRTKVVYLIVKGVIILPVTNELYPFISAVIITVFARVFTLDKQSYKPFSLVANSTRHLQISALIEL